MYLARFWLPCYDLVNLEIGANALKFIMWGNIIFKNIFWYVLEYALEFSACGYTLALLLLSSLLHLVIQISALISSAFGKILAASFSKISTNI